MLREVKCAQRNVRELFFKVNGTGTAAINVGAQEGTLTDNGTGSYKIAFAKPGKRLLGVFVQCVADAGDLGATVHTDTSNLLAEIRLWDMTDGTTAKDGIFYLRVVLSDSDEV
jgi:hypothetical protein